MIAAAVPELMKKSAGEASRTLLLSRRHLHEYSDALLRFEGGFLKRTMTDSASAIRKGGRQATYLASHPTAIAFKALSPDSNFLAAWNLSSLLMLIWIIFFVPLQSAFIFDSLWAAQLLSFEEESDWFKIIDFLVNLFFLVDVFVGLRTGFYREDGVLDQNPRHAALNYIIRGSFVIDVASCVPFVTSDVVILLTSVENVQEGGGGGGAAGALQLTKVLKVTRLFKIAKLLRLLKLGEFLERLEDELSISGKHSKILVLLATMFLMSHFCACIYIAATTLGAENSGSWTDPYRGSSFWKVYLVAMYWSFTTMTTVGYGDITPDSDNSAEIIACMLLMIASGVFYGYLIATLSSIVLEVDANQLLVSNKMAEVESFMNSKSFPKALRRRVRAYYRQYFERKSALNESSVFAELTPELRIDVGFFLVDSTLREVSLFKCLTPSQLFDLSARMAPMVVEKGVRLLKKGEDGDKMFVVINGELEVRVGDKAVCVFTSGAFFGELCALGVSHMRTADVVVTKESELYSLGRSDIFSSLAENSPDAILAMIKIAACETYEGEEEMTRPKCKGKQGSVLSAAEACAAALATAADQIQRGESDDAPAAAEEEEEEASNPTDLPLLLAKAVGKFSTAAHRARARIATTAAAGSSGSAGRSSAAPATAAAELAQSQLDPRLGKIIAPETSGAQLVRIESMVHDLQVLVADMHEQQSAVRASRDDQSLTSLPGSSVGGLKRNNAVSGMFMSSAGRLKRTREKWLVSDSTGEAPQLLASHNNVPGRHRVVQQQHGGQHHAPVLIRPRVNSVLARRRRSSNVASVGVEREPRAIARSVSSVR